MNKFTCAANILGNTKICFIKQPMLIRYYEMYYSQKEWACNLIKY